MENDYEQKKSGYGKRPLWQWVVIYLVLAAIVYGLIYYFVLSNGGGYTAAPSQTYPSAAQSATQAVSPATSQPPNPTGLPASGKSVVTYTDSGFSPSTLTIKKGDTVTFKNTASDAMWVASNPHPVHTAYPTKGGCVSSTFDSCGNISPGQSWSFTFDVIGKWGFHNHLNPNEGGTIVVQ